jgi:predicted glycoside hydrolase/deacetylase ChbG (UPF0249 family)
MKRLIVNADDFGLCQGANLGILRAHDAGIVTSATLMVTMPGAPEAFELAKSLPTLGVGLHINLTAGRPLRGDVPSLTGPDGAFLRLPALGERALQADLEQEIGAQVEAFLAAGLTPTHLDSHHHVHLEIPGVGAIVARLGRELGIPVRGMGDVPFTGAFYKRENVTVERMVAFLAGLAPGTTTEVMSHPAYLDPFLLTASSYNLDRVYELAMLTDPAVWDAIERYDITLTNYRDLCA